MCVWGGEASMPMDQKGETCMKQGHDLNLSVALPSSSACIFS